MTTTLTTPPASSKKNSNKSTASTTSKAYQSVNPNDGKTFKTFGVLTDAQLETAIKKAAACFEIWRHTSFAERAAIVTKAATIMREHADEFAKPVTLEMGKRISESLGEVALSADIIDYYAWNAENFLAPQILKPKLGDVRAALGGKTLHACAADASAR